MVPSLRCGRLRRRASRLFCGLLLRPAGYFSANYSAFDGAIDLAVGFVGGDEEFVFIFQAEGGEVDEQVVFVGQGEVNL